MGDGYVRQSAADIVTGEVVEAAPINAELNQIRDAFHETSGHAHDGTTGEGPKIGLETSVSGVLPVANGGFAGIHKVDATTAPAATDDTSGGYAVGSHWLDITNDKAYVCVDATANNAVWIYLGSAGSGAWQPLDTDLTAIAALTSAADKGLQSTGSGTWALYDLTAAGKALLDDANAAAQLVTLGLTATAAELNTLDGITASVAELNTLTGITATVAELNTLDGITATVTELNYVDGVTSSLQTQLDAKQPLDATLTALAGVTTAADKLIYATGADTFSTTDLTLAGRALLDDTTAAAQLLTLGLTATAAELNTLDGITASTTELNYTDGVTSNIQTQIDTKAPIASPSFTGVVSVPDGTALAPSYAFTNDPDTGIYSSGINAMGVSAGGSQVADFTATGLSVTGAVSISGAGSTFRATDGSAAAPAYRFTSDNDTGMYLSSGIAFSFASSLVFRIQSDGDIEAPGIYAKTTGNAASVYVDGNGLLYRSTSALKYKDNLEPITNEQMEAWLSYDGFTYTSKDDDSGKRYFGFAADHAQEAGLEELVTLGDDGQVEGYEYGRDMPIAKAIIKDLLAKVESLTARVEALENNK